MILANLELIQTNDTLPEPNYKNLTKLCCTESRYTRCMYEIFLIRKTTSLYLDSSLSTINAQCISAPYFNENDTKLFIILSNTKYMIYKFQEINQ